MTDNTQNLFDRLRSSLSAKKDDPKALFDSVASLVTSTYDLDTLVGGSLEILRKHLLASYVKIVLVDRDEFLFFNSVGHHNEKMYPTDLPKLERMSIHRVALESELPAGELKEWMMRFEIALLYKLEVRGVRIGYLFLGNKAGNGPYTPAQIETLSIVVDQLAIAFSNALAVRRISAFNEELKKEVEMATRSLQKANEDLKQLDKLKDEFVSMASHELKSPLNAVKNYLWLSLNKKGSVDEEKFTGYLKTAYRATEEVLLLVNDLLDVSRIESGRLVLAPAAVEVKTIVDEVMAIFEQTAKNKSLAINTEVEAGIKAQADATRLREIISNLVSNAIKYTLEGNVKVVVRAEKEDKVIIEVIDTGIGIKPDDLDHMFEKFTRFAAGDPRLAGTEGSGLGLFITKKLVELMNGEIGVESQVGKGSRFWFTLPKAG